MYGNPDSVCRRMRDVFTEVTGSCCERLRFRGATDHHYLLSGPPRLISLFFSCFFHPPPRASLRARCGLQMGTTFSAPVCYLPSAVKRVFSRDISVHY